jgi:hypothetical protein
VPFVHRLRVRFHECDPQGVVFNAHYFAYFDVALTEMWRAAFGSYANVVQGGTDVVVVEAGATFRVPARFDDRDGRPSRRRAAGRGPHRARVRRPGDDGQEGDPRARPRGPRALRGGVAAMHEIEALERTLHSAVAARDVDALERLLGQEFTLTTGRPGHEVRGRAEYSRSPPRSTSSRSSHRPAGWQLVSRHVSPLAASGP